MTARLAQRAWASARAHRRVRPRLDRVSAIAPLRGTPVPQRAAMPRHADDATHPTPRSVPAFGSRSRTSEASRALKTLIGHLRTAFAAQRRRLAALGRPHPAHLAHPAHPAHPAHLAHLAHLAYATTSGTRTRAHHGAPSAPVRT
jgi:hypothetical protein